jgi:hypothetical protein
MRTVLPFAIFLLFLGLWTWKLLEPNPVPEVVRTGIPTDLKFWVSKAVHVGGYTFLTVLASFLPIRRPFFRVVIGILALHAIGTETGQTYVPNRHGSVYDVFINWFGIGLGLCAVRWLNLRGS